MNALQTNHDYGIHVNRLRKLMREWNHWHPLRQTDPLRGKNAEQAMAEIECSRLAPIIGELKWKIAKIEEGVS